MLGTLAAIGATKSRDRDALPSWRRSANPAIVEFRLDILEAIASGEAADRVLELICRGAERIAPDLACAILRADTSGQLWTAAGSAAPTERLRTPAALNGALEPQQDSVPPTDEFQFVDVTAHPEWAVFGHAMLPQGHRSSWLMPLASGNTTIGALVACREHHRDLDWPVRQLLACSAHLAVLAMRETGAQCRLEQSNHHFRVALSGMTQGLCLFDESERLLLANDRYAEIYGLRPEDVRPGISLSEIVALRVAAGSGPAMQTERYLAWQEVVCMVEHASDAVVELENGKVISIHLQPLPNNGWVATHEDITDRRRAEARIAHMARHDGLTGLANRVLLQERLEQALHQPGGAKSHAVLCIDLDRFKAVNDSFGHSIGDKLLQAVASRLLSCVREADTVARMGGDEFAILLLQLDRPDKARDLAQRVVRVLTDTFQIEGNTVSIGASVGIAISPSDADTPEELINHADMAMYRAKMDGRGRYCFFEADMGVRLQERLNLERDLRLALLRNEFELLYQPLVDLERGAVSGFEALLRWRHAEHGLLMPDKFIGLTEETGLIVPIGAWVLRQACEEASTWPPEISVSVNLSPVQFKSSDLVEVVRATLAATGLDAGRLELEITESTLLEDSVATLDTLHELGQLGVRFSMDDFGTGYSSLSYLRSFPFDKIKIDQSFIRDLTARTNSLAIVRAIVGLGRSLNMLTTAEGVETQEQFDSLRAEGCDEVQGYYLSHPRPASDIPALLALQIRETASQ